MESSKNFFGVAETDAKKNNPELSESNHLSFGRHVAHKHQDTMGEILKNHTGVFEKFRYNHDSDFVDLRFKEPEHPENGETVLTETDQRQKAYKHHDTMAEIIKNGSDANFGKIKYNHVSDIVDKRFNANIENIDVCQVNIKGRKGAHKYQDTMGDIVQSGANVEKFKYNRDSDFIDNRFKEADLNSENQSEKLTDTDGHYIKKDIRFHHNPIW